VLAKNEWANGLEEYHKIAEAMRAMKGSAILTINDHPEM